jgi:hypothetical protein
LGEGRGEGCQNALDISQHVVVPKSENGIALFLQPLRSRGIARNSLCMLPAVDLDNEARLFTQEIDDKSAHRDLPAKLGSLKSSATQVIPKSPFRIAGFRAQIPGIRFTGSRAKAGEM